VGETIQFEINRKQESGLSKVNFDNLPFGRIISDHMFTAEYRDGKWQDFKIEPYGAMQVFPAMISLHYAQAIFEGLKAYRNNAAEVVLFRPDENAARFARSAQRLCMPVFPEDVFVEAVAQLVSLDRDWVPGSAQGSLYIRPHMFGIDEYIGVQPSQNYRFVIFTSPSGAYFSRPTRMKIEDTYARACQGGLGAAKAGANYAAALYPTKLAVEQGFDQVIWTNPNDHKHIEEAGTMNIFVRLNDELLTPPLNDTILAGITRKSVITLAHDLGIKVTERKVSVEEILNGARNGDLKEAFGAGTAAVIQDIAEIGYKDQVFKLPTNHSGEAFSSQIRKSLEQIRSGEAADSHNWIRKVTELDLKEA